VHDKDEKKSWDSERAQAYLDNAELHVIERGRTLTILERLFAYHFQGRRGLKLLDLGCGDGFVTESLRSKHPDHTFCLLDGSEFMIEKARKRLKGPGLFFVTETFENFCDAPKRDDKYDYIYSSNAIHHLSSAGKRRMYFSILQRLTDGGLFLNSDPVSPASERSEKWQFNLWIDWMREFVEQRNLAIQPEVIEKVPSQYKNKPENQPDGLFEQLQMLREAGFHDVDCFYKYGIFALFGGTR